MPHDHHSRLAQKYETRLSARALHRSLQRSQRVIMEAILALPFEALAVVPDADLASLTAAERVQVARSVFLRGYRSSKSEHESISCAFAYRILMSLNGADVTLFKVAFDDLESDLYIDFAAFMEALAPAQRAEALAFITREAADALAEWNEVRGDAFHKVPLNPLPREVQPHWFPVKVFSDYDDTQQVKLFDHSFPNNTVYPGLRAFLLAAQGRVPASYLTPELATAESGDATTPAPATGTPSAAAGGVDSGAIGGAGAIGAGDDDDLLAGGLTGDDTPSNGGETPLPGGAGAVASALRTPVVGTGVEEAFAATSISAPAAAAAAAAVGAPAATASAADAATGAAASPAPPDAAAAATVATPAPALDVAPAASKRHPFLHLFCPTGHTNTSGLVYISARPPAMKNMTWKAANRLIGVRPQGILCGSLMTSIRNSDMAAKKTANFNAYNPLYPEYRTVWLGDSGQ